jgi:hypothetical protein
MNYASTILRVETAARQKNCSPDELCAGVRYREMADRHSPKCGARPALSIDSTPLCSMRNKIIVTLGFFDAGLRETISLYAALRDRVPHP